MGCRRYAFTVLPNCCASFHLAGCLITRITSSSIQKPKLVCVCMSPFLLTINCTTAWYISAGAPFYRYIWLYLPAHILTPSTIATRKLGFHFIAFSQLLSGRIEAGNTCMFTGNVVFNSFFLPIALVVPLLVVLCKIKPKPYYLQVLHLKRERFLKRLASLLKLL